MKRAPLWAATGEFMGMGAWWSSLVTHGGTLNGGQSVTLLHRILGKEDVHLWGERGNHMAIQHLFHIYWYIYVLLLYYVLLLCSTITGTCIHYYCIINTSTICKEWYSWKHRLKTYEYISVHIFQTIDRTSCPKGEKSMGHGFWLSVLKQQKW